MKITEKSSLTDLLSDLKDRTPVSKKHVSLDLIIDEFQDRGFGVLLFFLALPAALPIPATGINMIIALPILILTLQQIVGRHEIWLPKAIRKKKFKTEHLHTFIDKSLPFVRMIEKLIHPRLSFFCTHHFTKIIGLFGTLFAISITLPIPFTNTVPAMAVALMSIGLILSDGLAIIMGILLGTFWVSLLAYLIIFFGTEGVHLITDFIKTWM